MTLKGSISLLTGLYVAVLVWWLSLFFSGSKSGLNNNIFGLFWGILIPFASTLLFYSSVFRLGYKLKYKADLKDSIAYLLVGIFIWGSANVVWSFYNFYLNVEVPFPSYADGVFMSSYPVLLYGLLGVISFDSCRVASRKRSFMGVIRTVTYLSSISIPILFGVAAKWGLLGDEIIIKLIINYLYIFFDLTIIVALALASVLRFKKFLVSPISSLPFSLYSLGFSLLLITDISFLGTSMTDSYFNGIYIDMLFITSFFLIILGVYKTVLTEFGITLVEERYPGSNFVIRMTYLKEFGLNCRGLLGKLLTLSFSYLLYFVLIFQG